MPSNYDIDLLRSLEAFLGVAETGSTTETAKRLHVTQSSISQHIRLLEKELGTRLVDRRHRPLRLTPAGLTLRQRGARLLHHARQAVTEIREFAAGPLPNLRIAMLAALAPIVAPTLVGAVARGEFPIENLSIMRGMAADHVRHLIAREVDIIVTSNSLNNMSSLERHELIEERFVLVLPKNRIPFGIGLQEIAKYLPMLRHSADTGSGQMIERHLRRQKLNFASTFIFDAPDDLLHTVAMGRGWAIATPTQVMYALNDTANIEFRALPKSQLARTIALVARAGELGNVPARLATLCRGVIMREHIPRMRSVMPALTDCFTVLDESGRPVASA